MLHEEMSNVEMRNANCSDRTHSQSAIRNSQCPRAMYDTRLEGSAILGTAYVIDEAGEALVSAEWVSAEGGVQTLTVRVVERALSYDDFRQRGDVPVEVLDVLAELAAAW